MTCHNRQGIRNRLQRNFDVVSVGGGTSSTALPADALITRRCNGSWLAADRPPRGDQKLVQRADRGIRDADVCVLEAATPLLISRDMQTAGGTVDINRGKTALVTGGPAAG